MNLNKAIVYGLVTILFLSALTGCTQSNTPQLAHALHFSLSDVSDVILSYNDEAMTFYEADSNEMVIKEYMTENKNRYYAKVKQDDDSIHISEGGKPFFQDDFSRSIEVYLPASYTKNLTVTTTDGKIDLSNINLELSTLRIDSTDGTIQLSKVSASDIHVSSTNGTLDVGRMKADTIRLETTSGNTICNELDGAVVYTSTSGNLTVKSALGSGSYQANNSGKLDVVYSKVMGDLSFFHKNEDIDLTIPKDLEFTLEAKTKNGTISTTFQEKIKADDRTTYGTIGNNPTVTIKAETNNGTIRITQSLFSQKRPLI